MGLQQLQNIADSFYVKLIQKTKYARERKMDEAMWKRVWFSSTWFKFSLPVFSFWFHDFESHMIWIES